jgi:peptide/nickel transport system permease protein
MALAPRRAVRRLQPTGSGLVGLVVVLIVFLGAAFAPLVAPHDPVVQTLAKRLTPPLVDATYPLGTDALGRDMLSRLLYGARLSLLVGLASVLLAGSLGVGLGLLAGYHGGWLDALIMRVADIQLSVPFLVLAIAVVSVLGAGLTNVVLILALTSWVTYGRLIRAEVLTLRHRDFVDAARLLGASDMRVLASHILPNVAASIIVVATLEVARMILAEASLSFLGLGVQPPDPAWGTMVADGRELLGISWWVSTLPGLAILITLLGINSVGDWLRDVLDPTVRLN